MRYADGEGIQQNYADAEKWWNRAAEGGHLLAPSNLARLQWWLGVAASADASKKWAQLVINHRSNAAH
jgi:TPR repeat protein